MSDDTDEFQSIVDGINRGPTDEQVIRLWAARQAADVLRGKAGAFAGLPSMDPGSVIVLADWIITGDEPVYEDEVDDTVDPDE